MSKSTSLALFLSKVDQLKIYSDNLWFKCCYSNPKKTALEENCVSTIHFDTFRYIMFIRKQDLKSHPNWASAVGSQILLCRCCLPLEFSPQCKMPLSTFNINFIFILFTARWLCASRTTTISTQSVTLAQIVALTSRWEATFGLEMWCTVRSTPERGTKASVVTLELPCPLAKELPLHTCPALDIVLHVCLKLHLTWLRYRLWHGAWRWTRSTLWHRMFFSDSFNHSLQYYDSLSCLSCNCMRIGALFSLQPGLHSFLKLFLALMMHSCHGLKPHHVVPRPDLLNTKPLDKLNRTDWLSEDRNNHLNLLLTQ